MDGLGFPHAVIAALSYRPRLSISAIDNPRASRFHSRSTAVPMPLRSHGPGGRSVRDFAADDVRF